MAAEQSTSKTIVSQARQQVAHLSSTDESVMCPNCNQKKEGEFVFLKDGGAMCRECFDCGLLKKIWNALFPKPKWVREFEAALEADTRAREEMYREWIETLTGGGVRS